MTIAKIHLPANPYWPCPAADGAEKNNTVQQTIWNTFCVLHALEIIQPYHISSDESNMS